MGEAITRHSLRPLRFNGGPSCLHHSGVNASRDGFICLKVVVLEYRYLGATEPDTVGLGAIGAGGLRLRWPVDMVTILAECCG